MDVIPVRRRGGKRGAHFSIEVDELQETLERVKQMCSLDDVELAGSRWKKTRLNLPLRQQAEPTEKLNTAVFNSDDSAVLDVQKN
ncbi:hypothetical protein M514_00302, partial [Trichuris suis]